MNKTDILKEKLQIGMKATAWKTWDEYLQFSGCRVKTECDLAPGLIDVLVKVWLNLLKIFLLHYVKSVN